MADSSFQPKIYRMIAYISIPVGFICFGAYAIIDGFWWPGILFVGIGIVCGLGLCVEFKIKAIKVKIQNTSIESKNYFGLYKRYDFAEMDGFQTSVMQSKEGKFESLHLIKNKQSVVLLSEYYHENYGLMKYYIEERCEYLGEVNMSALDYWKIALRKDEN